MGSEGGSRMILWHVKDLLKSLGDLIYQGPHRYQPGIEHWARGRSSETTVSPHYNNQCTLHRRTIYRDVNICNRPGYFKHTVELLTDILFGGNASLRIERL
jgi:hypothetical protein